MTAPVLQKTWQGGSTLGGTEFVNVVVGGTTPPDTLLAIKNAMIGFNANPWTVIGSCDGITSGMDGVDRWVNTADLVYRGLLGSPLSWIVLQQTAIGATYQVMFSLSIISGIDPQKEDIEYQANKGGFGVANGGANDGSISSLPAVADNSLTTKPTGKWWLGHESSSPTQKVLTCISSTDGECLRVIVSHQSTGNPILCLGAEVPRLPPASWAGPAVIYIFKATVASALSCFRWETMADSIGAGAESVIVGAVPRLDNSGFDVANMVPLMPMFSTTEVVDFREDDRPNPLLYPCALYGYDTDVGSGVEGIHGTLFDWYWCTRNVLGKHLLDLDTIPAAQDATPQTAWQFYNDEWPNPASALSIADVAQTGMDPTADLTLEIWGRPSAWPGGVQSMRIVEKQGNYTLYIDNLGTQMQFQAGGISPTTRATGLASSFTDEWHHFAVTRKQSNGEVKMFIDGVQVGTTATVSVGVAMTPNSDPVLLGGPGGGGNYNTDFVGHLTDFRLWSAVRTPAEIAASYNVAMVGNEANLECYLPAISDALDLTANGNDFAPILGGVNNTLPAITSVARPFVGNMLIAPRTFVCVGDCVFGWLDDDATDLSYT